MRGRAGCLRRWGQTGGEVDGSAGAAGAGDITVCVCNDGDKTWGACDGVAGRLAEAISGELNSQDIANTLWAFATMGTKPGERIIGQLERRAEVI
jgi:hypothetical protein